MVRAFRGKHFLLPNEEDDLCDNGELQEPALPEIEEEDEPMQVRVYEEEEEIPVMLEDGTEEQEILAEVPYWGGGQPEIVDVVSPMHNFLSTRPLSSAS